MPRCLKFGLGRKNVEAESLNYSDNGPARFDRLLALVEGVEDEFGWKDLQETQVEMISLRPGHVLACAAELYESDVSKLSAASGILSMLPLMKSISQMTGKPLQGMENFDDNTVEAVGAFGAAMKGSSVVLGDILESDWKLVFSIPAGIDVEGDAYVVGKVSKVWGAGEWRPLPGLPVFSQLPRAQRREMERKGPAPDGKMMWQEGPAVLLDVLAVYR